jgi:hypothetical protein
MLHWQDVCTDGVPALRIGMIFAGSLYVTLSDWEFFSAIA